LGSVLAAARAAALAAGLGADFAAADGLTAGLRGTGFFGAALAGLGADFLTAGLALERAAGAAALAFFTREGRLALRRSFAMLVLLSRASYRR
jgi:hypothetical protein